MTPHPTAPQGTPETLRTLVDGALFVEAHGIDADLLGRVHAKMLAHAAAWEAKEEQFRRVGNALVEAGFTPLGDDYAASVEAMSRSYENSKDDGEADRRRLEALSDPGLLSWARAIIRAWNRADGKEQQRMYASMKVAEKLLAALATETT